MSSQRLVATTARLGMRWLRDNPPTSDLLLPVADDVWFYEMLLLRHARTHPTQESQWASHRDTSLARMLKIAPDAYLANVTEDLWAEELVAVAMFAHLGFLLDPTAPATLDFVHRFLSYLDEQAHRLGSLPPLLAFCLAHNLREMGAKIPAAVQAPVNEQLVVRGLTGPERTLAAAYLHTHLILFAHGTYRRTPESLEPLGPSFHFITEHTTVVAGYGWADLCAEFAICLSLAGRQDKDFWYLIDALVKLQSPDGRWTHPRIDERQSRHSTMMSVLALFEVEEEAGRG